LDVANALVLGLVVLSCAASDGVPGWISQNAVSIRSIDPGDENFSDLEPLLGAIGSARVVQLGEPSHGAGSSFAAKVRLIKFLHQRMGFDVVAWESGMYEVRLAQAGLRGGEDAVAAAQRGVFSIWSKAEEVRPLFEYAKASQGTTRPLDMAGFDVQITAPHVADRLAADLRAFVLALHDPKLRVSGTDELPATIRSNRVAFEKAHGAREVRFMERVLANMRTNEVNVKDRAARSDVWNRRDSLMADNLSWLIKEGYPGRKIIVWAHNAHLMNAHFTADWRTVHAERQPGGMTPMGALVAEKLKDEVYTIAFTTYAGEDRWANGQRSGPIAPAPECSLEARLHALGKPYVFVDFRAVKNKPNHPMRTPQSMRVSGYGPPTGQYGNDLLPDPTAAFDAVFYVDQMAPATPIQR
jgi:erythromycin esterase